MAEGDQGQKTEAPTGKRLSEARERGQLPISREAANFVLFLGILLSVGWFAAPMADDLVPTLRFFLEMPHSINLEGDGVQVVLREALIQVGRATIAIFLIMAAAAILGIMAQTGFFASFESIHPNFGRISPVAGLQRLFSPNSLVELAKSFAKLVVLGFIVYLVLKPVVLTIPAAGDRSILDVVAYLHQEAVHLIIMLMLAYAFVALSDLVYQRYTYTKNLRMTKVEVKDEFKQQEGDPMIKSRLRQIRLEKARKRMMAQVPKADVVITNPTHYAIALQYDNKKMTAPRVLAKGVDNVAERIRDVATEHSIPLVSNPPLARTLYDTVEIDQEIPTQHYRAVAEVISFVYKLRKRRN